MLAFEFFCSRTIFCGVQSRRESRDHWPQICRARTMTTTAGIFRALPGHLVPIRMSGVRSPALCAIRVRL